MLSSLQVFALETSLSLYDWVVRYHSAHLEPVERVFPEELAICTEMVELLPFRIASIRATYTSTSGAA